MCNKCIFFKGVFTLLVRFLHLSFRFFRSAGLHLGCGCLVLGAVSFCGFGCVPFSPVVVCGCFGGLVALLLWAGVAVVLRSAFFVRFSSPSSALGSAAASVLRPFAFPPCAWGCGGFSGCAFRWRVCSASALPSVRRSALVWAVRPAVVARRSGVVLFFWVFVAQNETETVNVNQNGISFLGGKSASKTSPNFNSKTISAPRMYFPYENENTSQSQILEKKRENTIQVLTFSKACCII